MEVMFLIAIIRDGKVCIETVTELPVGAQVMAIWRERENV